jgi:hypothetical protein
MVKLGINLNKGLILGVAGGLTVFIIVLIIIMYVNSDFDQHLINQVDSGVPADKLIPQIDAEAEHLQMNAQKNYESNLINNNLGGNASNYDYYTQIHQNELKIISEYENDQKEFAERQITKEQFLHDIQSPKQYINVMNLN